jgi:hypothetical protein
MIIPTPIKRKYFCLRGTDGAVSPFFSPDGEWVGFFANFKMKKVSVQGGAPVTLCDAPAGVGASWGDDGRIVAALNAVGELTRIPADGGTPQQLTNLENGDFTHRWPQVLPGGRAVLFTASTAPTDFNNAHIDVLSLGSGKMTTLVRGGYFGRYVPSAGSVGYLLYIREGTLYAVAFNPTELTVHGKPEPVLQDVAANSSFGGGQFDISRTGDFYYRSGAPSSSETYPVLWVDGPERQLPFSRNQELISRLVSLPMVSDWH